MEHRMIVELTDSFNSIAQQVSNESVEFWYARDLQERLGYTEYRNFLPVIQKAKESCLNSGQRVADHFVDMHEMVSIGSGAERKIDSYALSRYACYLIVQNGDSSKPVIDRSIHASKGLKKSQQILDNMGSTELAANLFRATQTEEKLRREDIHGKSQANITHYEVGKKVRQTIEELGGTMPENLPTPDVDLKKLGKLAGGKQIVGGEG